jgi:hypothetical protein
MFIELTIRTAEDQEDSKVLLAVDNIRMVLPPHPQDDSGAGAFIRIIGQDEGLDIAEGYEQIRTALSNAKLIVA